MTRRKKLWLLAAGAAAGVVAGGMALAGWWAARNFEPFLQARTVEYLERRFDADVRLERLKVKLRWRSTWDVLAHRGRGSRAEVDAGPLELRFRADPQLPPVLSVTALKFTVDLETLGEPVVMVREARVEGLVIHVPPRRKGGPSLEKRPGMRGAPGSEVVIGTLEAPAGRLVILPRDARRTPLVFEMHRLTLRSAGRGLAMRYETELTNAKPPGLIHCRGTFGPWVAESPSDTPLTGVYTLDKADLGVFRGIAGTLSSQGKFGGVLGEIVVDGTTRTPDFRLTASGNAVPLETWFHAVVDGTNGDTRLEPVSGKLGESRFTVNGSVERDAAKLGRTVTLNAAVTEGRLTDFLRLAMKGERAFMSGGVGMRGRIVVPPGRGDISERLQLEGTFRLTEARFTSRTVQEQIDGLSRRAQGQPSNEQITEVPCAMSGQFDMAGGAIRFPRLGFSIPGAEVGLEGTYRFGPETLDFEGEARIEAKVSEMMKSRWKRWVLKPVDPFFSKKGFGTVTKIRISGTRGQPKFGRM